MSPDFVELVQPLASEAILASGVALLLVTSRIGALRERAGEIALLVVAASAAGAVVSMDVPHRLLAWGTIAVDPFGAFFKFVLSLVALSVVWLATRSREAELGRSGVSWSLFLASLIGMSVMATAVSIAAAWAGFAVASVCGALWIASRADPDVTLPAADAPAEVGRAVLLQGMAASAMMLLGLSLLFALTGSLDYAGLEARLPVALASPGGKGVMLTAIVLTIAGIGSRLAMVPWHMLRAGVADASPLPAAAWMQAAQTLAGLALLARFVRCVLCAPGTTGGWATLPGVEWPPLLSVAAMATMTVGNLAALRATSARRLFAWLTVAQGGYLLTGLVALSDRGLEAMLFHGVAYALMSIGALAALAPIADAADSTQFEILRGLARRRGGAKFLAVALSVFSLSLAGVPPLAGYTGRVYLLSALLDAGRSALVVVAAFNSVIGLLCCVRVVGTMLDRPLDPDEPVAMDFEAGLLVVLLLFGTVWLGLLPAPLATFVARSVVFFGG